MSSANPAPVHWLTAYRLEDADELDMPLIPAPSRRTWMDEGTHAYHCLPLKMANQAGWFVLNSHAIEVVWTGDTDRSSVMVRYIDAGPPQHAVSHFGYALLTFRVPYLFRTSPGYNLLVRGPANHPKDGAFALDGLIETDWSPAAFFMSWRITRVNEPVRFERGEPICMIVPQPRGDLERFVPRVRDLASEPSLEADYMRWRSNRLQHLDVGRASRAGVPDNWLQRDYARGRFPNGPVASEHQTRLRLWHFEDRPSASVEPPDSG
jgi:uncharacterized protein DUF6065